MEIYEELWAKNHGLDEPYPLLAHMLDSACMAGQLFDHWLRPGLQQILQDSLGDDARAIVMWLVGCHDLGKANPVFQGQLAARHTPGSAEELTWACVRETISKAGRCSFDLPSSITANAASFKAYRRHEQVSASYFLCENGGQDSWLVENWAAIPAMGHHGRFAVPFADLSGSAARAAHRS